MTLVHEVNDLSMDIPVRCLPMNKLEPAAIKHFKARNPRKTVGQNTIGIVVNYIRHQLSPYDKLLDATRLAKGNHDKRQVLMLATLKAISLRYAHEPRIRAECERQFAKKFMIAEGRSSQVWRAD